MAITLKHNKTGLNFTPNIHRTFVETPIYVFKDKEVPKDVTS